MLLIYIWKKKPFIKKAENMTILLMEGFFFVAIFSFYPLIDHTAFTEPTRIILAWIVIMFFTLIIFT